MDYSKEFKEYSIKQIANKIVKILNFKLIQIL